VTDVIACLSFPQVSHFLLHMDNTANREESTAGFTKAMQTGAVGWRLQKAQESKQMEEDMIGYMDWLIEAEDVDEEGNKRQLNAYSH